MDNSRNRYNDHLGINRISRNIRKSPPIHQQAFANPRQQQQQQQPQQQQHGGGEGSQQPPQPQVYNISKNDFRSVVQQLTGTPTRDPFPSAAPPPVPGRPAATHNPPKLPSMRLQKIRPPPLTPIARPPIPHPAHNPAFYPRPAPVPVPMPAAPPPPQIQSPGGAFWRAALESPTTAYMRYLENSIINGDGSQQTPRQMQMQVHPRAPQRQQEQPQVSGLLPNPFAAAAPFPSPPSVPASSGLLPSPASQLFMASPTAFMNLSPFPMLSPKFQYPPLSPSFQFSPLPGQSGILGPVPPHPPGSPLLFPPSPSGFLLSPRWRDM